MNQLALRRKSHGSDGDRHVLPAQPGPARLHRPFRHVVLITCVGVPLLLLSASYIWLAIEHVNPLLWGVVVHESGHYTLGGTILYYGHFLREIPIDVAYALFLATYFARAGFLPDKALLSVRRRALAVACTGAILSVALGALAFFAAARYGGVQSAFYDLLQFRTRDNLLEFGSHWHFHWLSTIWFGSMTMVTTAIVAQLSGHPTGALRRLDLPVRWLPWIYVTTLTLVFGLSMAIFADVRYTGHQAREVVTHGPITGLLGLGTLYVVFMLFNPRASFSEERTTLLRRFPKGTWPALLLIISIPIFLAAVSLTGDVMAVGQSEGGLAAMIAGHVFEHTLDYLFVAVLAMSFYGFLVLYTVRTEPGNGRD